MRKNKFSFRWKVVENYAAAISGIVFLWLFVTGIIESDISKILASFIIISIAPFLVAYVDKKSAGA